MAITKSFAGRNINIPGAYSTSRVDNAAGSDIESNDTLLLVGESTKGAPGDVEGIQEFTSSQLSTLIAKYGQGPLVDCALAAVRPSADQTIGGAGRVLIWKTNSSTQADAGINEATDSNRLFIVKDPAYGVEGNQLSITIANGTSSLQKAITIKKLNDTSESLGENAADAVLSVQYTGDATTAVIEISGASEAAKQLTTTLAGDQTDGSADLAIDLKDYSMIELKDFINAQTGYTASLVTTASAAKRGTELDSIASVDVTSTVSLYRLQYELLELVNENSDRVQLELDSTPRVGLPVNVTDLFLTGGAQGASTNTDFSDGLAESLAEDYNVAMACVSRDAADSIADTGARFQTDASSTYTIASVNAAVDSHLKLRGQVENRKEAQGFGAIRDADKADCYAEAQSLNSELMQIAFQDVLVVNELGSLEWQQPETLAAQMAGIRLGTEVGTPLTHKRPAARAFGHFVDRETGLSSGDFNPDLDKTEAVNAGVTFLEKNGSTSRIVVDNTTYGVDESFVFNRGSVVEAAQFVAKDIRSVAERVFIGNKLPNEQVSGGQASNGAARSIKRVIANRLRELNQPDVNILSSSLDAPEGFVEETFTVEVVGNTARVAVEVKPVQGLDFIFITFTLGDVTQSA